MDVFKKFFEKKKTDIKFGKAGQGKKLTEASSSSGSAVNKPTPPQARINPSNSAQKAGQAALERFSAKPSGNVDWSLHAIKTQARREMEAEKKLLELSAADKPGTAIPPSTQTERPIQPVLFTSPFSGDEPDTYEVVKERIREALYEQLAEDESKMVAACLIIYTCNKNKEKIQICVDTLRKYLHNVILHPSEEKYRRIRVGNPAFSERVAAMQGGVELLRAVGFIEQQLSQQPDDQAATETFYVQFVFPSDGDVESLNTAMECLEAGEAVRPVLHRSPAVLLPQQAARQPVLPPEFFTLTKEELLREMQLRKEAVEESLVLRTKAMRDRANAREMRKYRFSFIRVRFPDGLTLQGTFKVSEKLQDFSEEDNERTLAEVFMVPAALLNFQWDETVSDEQLDDFILLKPEALEQLIEQQPENQS
ncbi:hypothetical protein HAZT_HAZT010573 [Hyalella azteca]|uniref:PUB domain-containing protein n=1 Tax=Hyalella azteca TaxID=294128 RepID=A0A6A0HB56_HYAAZ|nr:hypothetical protein HAZT_HAZT010573 [Hyalella azteca]